MAKSSQFISPSPSQSETRSLLAKDLMTFIEHAKSVKHLSIATQKVLSFRYQLFKFFNTYKGDLLDHLHPEYSCHIVSRIASRCPWVHTRDHHQNLWRGIHCKHHNVTLAHKCNKSSYWSRVNCHLDICQSQKQLGLKQLPKTIVFGFCSTFSKTGLFLLSLFPLLPPACDISKLLTLVFGQTRWNIKPEFDLRVIFI